MTRNNSSSLSTTMIRLWDSCYTIGCIMLMPIIVHSFHHHHHHHQSLHFSTTSSAQIYRRQSNTPQTPSFRRHHWSDRPSTSSLSVSDLRDADFAEMMVGGIRYEMVPLPDSMMDTTLFVGNFDEFVHDDDLSQLFQVVSNLQSVPACVARRPNMASLHYGFVAFQTPEEKEAAILRFNGCEWRGQAIKVEPIRDNPKVGRVRVPERMVQYVTGSVKKTRDGRTNTMRRIARHEEQAQREKQQENKKKRKQQQKQKEQQNSSIACMVSRLSVSDQQEFLRAIRKGFVSLEGTGYRRGRKSSNLACVHRQWCDENEVPQIILCKASGGRPLDNVIVDLSPLRVSAMLLSNSNSEIEQQPNLALIDDDFLLEWKVQIMTTATEAGMDFRTDYVQDNCAQLSACDEDAFEDGCDFGFDTDDVESSLALKGNVCGSEDTVNLQGRQEYVITLTDSDFSASSKPISQLPVLSMGVFEGERSMAKTMARNLVNLWEIPQEPSKGLLEQIKSSCSDADAGRRGGKQRKRKSNTNNQDERRRQRRQLDNLEFYFK